MIERLICDNICVATATDICRERRHVMIHIKVSAKYRAELTAPLHVTKALSSSLDKAAVTLIDTSDFRV